MNVPNLHFSRIVIDRLDGLEPSGFALEELEPGINIVYGPNASGKTSLSGAIHQLLAPHVRVERFRRAVLRASLQLDVEAVLLDFEMGDVRVQRGANGQQMPLLVPDGIGDRYIFALDDLLQGNASDLADELLRQSAGGFDLRAARNELAFRTQVSTRGIVEYKNLVATRTRVETIRAEQEQLVQDERRLADLQIEYNHTRAATARAGRLEKAAAWMDARRGVSDLAEDLACFPAHMANLRGDEAELLRQLRAKLTAIESAKQQNSNLQRAAEERLVGAAFGPDPPDEQLVGVLRQKCQRLRTLAATCEEKKTRVAAAAKELEQARNVLGSRAPDPNDPLLDAEKVDRLLAFVHQGESLRSKMEAANELDGWLSGLENGQAAAGSVDLERAVQLLGRWLAVDETTKTLPSTDAASRQRPVVLGAAIAWGLLAVTLALTVHLSWFLGLVVSGGLVLWALWPRQAHSATDPRPSLQGEFAKLGVQLPTAWSTEAVGARLRELQNEARAAAFEQVRTARWSDLETRLSECRRRLKNYLKELAVSLREAGLADDALRSGEGALILLAKNIVRCQQAYGSWEGLQAEMANLQQQCRDQLAGIRQLLAPYGYATPDIETAATQIEDLARRLAQHQAAVSERKTCERERERLASEETAAASRIVSFFETNGIAPDDDTELYRRLEQLPHYRQADEALKRARRDLELKARDLGDVAPFEQVDADSVAAELAECRIRAERAESVHKEMIAIQTRVQMAKQKSDLEQALAGQAKAQGALAAQREADCDAIAGDLLCEHLDEQQRDLQQPAVLERARHLFGRITHGRYRLDISRAGEGEPAFRAVETARSRVLPLDQLSGGTRLQLVFAVRLAFLEMQESQWKLPLVLDETLGNSDEARAEQIIDAAIEICRQGRQVFYLTAQHDEVSKWRRRLKGCPDIRWKHVDLAEVRNFSTIERIPAVDYAAPLPLEVAHPDGEDWFGYGKRLQVPRPDAYSKPDSLHPWYMVGDVQLLYRLLKQGINLWGQLRELVSLDSLPADCADLETGAAALLRAEARADLLETVFRYWRIGRGKPVDRSVLEASGAINDRFLPEVSQLAKQLGHDARRILEALADGKVPRFQQRNREKLQEYLAEHDYLDENEPLSADVVKQRAKIEAFDLIKRGLIDPFCIEVLIDLIYATSENAVGSASA